MPKVDKSRSGRRKDNPFSLGASCAVCSLPSQFSIAQHIQATAPGWPLRAQALASHSLRFLPFLQVQF